MKSCIDQFTHPTFCVPNKNISLGFSTTSVLCSVFCAIYNLVCWWWWWWLHFLRVTSFGRVPLPSSCCCFGHITSPCCVGCLHKGVEEVMVWLPVKSPHKWPHKHKILPLTHRPCSIWPLMVCLRGWECTITAAPNRCHFLSMCSHCLQMLVVLDQM